MPALPFIPAAVSVAGGLGSLFNHGSVQSGAASGTDAIRQFVTNMLMGKTNPTQGPAGQLTVDPSASLAGTNGLFAATRASALGQAKESAGNLTGSGGRNLFGSALATSLAGQQKMLADTQLAASQGNQKTWADLFGQFGNTGVGGGQYFQKGPFSGLAGAGGALGQLAAMFGGQGGSGSNVSTDRSTAPFSSWDSNTGMPSQGGT